MRTLRRYQIAAAGAERGLFNPLIQMALVFDGAGVQERSSWYSILIQTPGETSAVVAHVALREANEASFVNIACNICLINNEGIILQVNHQPQQYAHGDDDKRKLFKELR